MIGIRTTIKTALVNTLKATPGVSMVFPSKPREERAQQFPALYIAIEKTNDTRVFAKRHITFTVTVYVNVIDPDPNEMAAQQRFDDLLDAIDAQLRSDPTLGGAVLHAAEKYIDTVVAEPFLAGNGLSVTLNAAKSFEVYAEINA